jgi:enamine deaminase RidA (YjgF/YER057c/UK114 family)
MIAHTEPAICNKKFRSFLPPGTGSFQDQLEECLRALAERAKTSEPGTASTLMLTFFIHAENNGDFFDKREIGLSRIQEFYGLTFPPASFVAQTPESGRQVALDAILHAGPAADRIRYKSCDGIRYSIVRSPRSKEIFAAGISSARPTATIRRRYREAFERLRRILRTEGLDFSHIIRQWNYIDRFLKTHTSGEGTRQTYQIFNDVRAEFYGSADFRHGYPASTGIGMRSGGIVLECIALKPAPDMFIAPLSNPLQRDAHAYSQDVLVGETRGDDQKKAPLFERAKIVTQGDSGIIFVSGTAAVRGQSTVHEEDAGSQTVAAIENIQALISAGNLLSAGVDVGPAASPLSHLRAYVKRTADLPAVKKLCRDHFGNVPSQFLVSDICRPSLLVEIEGTVCVPIRGVQKNGGR